MNKIIIVAMIISQMLLSGCQEIKVTTANNTVATTPPTILSSWITQLGATTKAYSGANNSLFDYCLSTAVDSSGNVYCAGATFGSTGETNGGNGDAFVMKLNSSGVIQWVRQLGSDTQASSALVNSTSGFDYCYGVAVDSSSNVYCAGYTSGALSETNGGVGNGDAFVMKLNSAGDIQWITQMGDVTEAASPHVNDTSGSESCSDVAVDNSGNVYCGGSTSGALAEVYGGNIDAFVMKLDSAGVIQWVRQIGDTTEGASAEVNDTAGTESCSSVAVDGSGNVFCAGNTNGALGEAAGGNLDAFVMKLDSAGAVTWLRHIGNTTQVASPLVVSTTQLDSFNGVAVDSAGNVVCAGYTQSSFAENNGGGNDALFAKFDTNGNIVWLSQIGSDTELASAAIVDTNQFDACSSVAVDNSDNIYCSGETGSNFGETPGGWQWDPMVLKLNSSGTVQWVKQFGSVTFPSADYYGGGAWGIAVDTSGTVYVSGEIYGDLDEVQGGGDNGDAFIAKIKSDGTLSY